MVVTLNLLNMYLVHICVSLLVNVHLSYDALYSLHVIRDVFMLVLEQQKGNFGVSEKAIVANYIINQGWSTLVIFVLSLYLTVFEILALTFNFCK